MNDNAIMACIEYAEQNSLAGTDEARADYAADRALLHRAAEVLKQLEWNDNHVDRYGKESFACPVCEALQEWGHSPDCALAALIRELESRLAL